MRRMIVLENFKKSYERNQNPKLTFSARQARQKSSARSDHLAIFLLLVALKGWYSELFTNQKSFCFFYSNITFRNNFLFFFLGILISKQIAPASLFSFQLRIKTPFLKNITDHSVFFLWMWNVKETPKSHIWKKPKKTSLSNQTSVTIMGHDLILALWVFFSKLE